MEFQGGESGRTIYVEYKKNTPAVVAVAFSSIVKVRISVEGDEVVLVVPAIMVGLLDTQYTVETLAFTLDLDARVVITGSEGGIDGPIESVLAKQGVDINTLPQITKEQFYDLTTEI